MFKFVLAACAIASVSAYSSTLCTSDQVVALTPLLAQEGVSDNIEVCQALSEWTFIPPQGEPTKEQKAIMCVEQSCLDLLSAVTAFGPPDCFLSLSNDPNVGVNVKKLSDEFEPYCFDLIVNGTRV